MSARLPPGLDLLKRKGQPGLVRARFYDKATGKRPSKTWPDTRPKRGKSGRTLAREWLDAQRVSVREQTYVAPNERTLGVYAARWLEIKPDLRPSTRQQYGEMINHLSATGLARRRLQQVTRSDVQAWVTDRSKVLGPVRVRTGYSILSRVFDAALLDRIVTTSPCVKIDLPPLPERHVESLTVEQVESLAAAMPERYRAGVLLGASLGLRVSEVLGLQRQDLDLLDGRNVVTVARQLGRDGRTMAPLKSKHSRRTIPLAAPIAVRVGVHLAKYDQGPEETVLISSHGNATTQKVYGRAFRAAVKTAGLPAGTSPHALRHHCATMLVASGLPINVCAAFLGHGDGGALLLRTYAHLLPDAAEQQRRVMDAVWSPDGSQGGSQGLRAVGD